MAESGKNWKKGDLSLGSLCAMLRWDSEIVQNGNEKFILNFAIHRSSDLTPSKLNTLFPALFVKDFLA